MSRILHIASASRYNNRTVIAGDRTALLSLRNALDDALLTGSGGAPLFCADGESHAVVVVRAEDMANVYTTYSGESDPARSGRETTPIQQLPFYLNALWKSDRTETAFEGSRMNPSTNTFDV